MANNESITPVTNNEAKSNHQMHIGFISTQGNIKGLSTASQHFSVYFAVHF